MEEHGEFIVTLNGNVIECMLKGSFNEKGTIAYTSNVKAKVEELDGKPFAMLIDDLALEGGTPKAYAALDEYNQWLMSQALAAKALIVSSFAQKEIMLQQAPTLKKQKIEFFTERKTAVAWLQQQLTLVDNLNIK
jgi:hypothetical protein